MDRFRVDGPAILTKRFPDLPARTRYVADADESTLRSIDRGVLFIMAFWSVSSFQSLGRLLEALAESGDAQFDLVIVDIDGAAPLARLQELTPFLRHAGGNGEILWVRDGKAFAATMGCRENPADYLSNLRLLAADP